MKLGAYLCHVPNEIMVILVNFCSEFLIKNRRNFTECAEAKMSEKWFSEFRMMLACAAFGFAVAVSLQDAHALYIEQKYAAPLENPDHGPATSSDYFFISLDNISLGNISLGNIAISRPLQSLDSKMGSRSRPGPANGVPALNGQVRNNPSNLANTFRLQFDDEKQLSNTNISDIKTEAAPYLNIDNRPSALEQGFFILAEQSAYMDRYIIDFVRTITRDNEIHVHAVYRNVSAATYPLYLFDSGFSGTRDNSYGVNSDQPEVVEHTLISKMLFSLLNSFSDGSFYMYFASFYIVMLGLKSLVEKFIKSH
ncbi:MAG: hypothetical protein ACOY15_11535 [Pseudomonadota bacterium]